MVSNSVNNEVTIPLVNIINILEKGNQVDINIEKQCTGNKDIWILKSDNYKFLLVKNTENGKILFAKLQIFVIKNYKDILLYDSPSLCIKHSNYFNTFLSRRSDKCLSIDFKITEEELGEHFNALICILNKIYIKVEQYLIRCKEAYIKKRTSRGLISFECIMDADDYEV